MVPFLETRSHNVHPVELGPGFYERMRPHNWFHKRTAINVPNGPQGSWQKAVNCPNVWRLALQPPSHLNAPDVSSVRSPVAFQPKRSWRRMPPSYIQTGVIRFPSDFWLLTPAFT